MFLFHRYLAWTGVRRESTSSHGFAFHLCRMMTDVHICVHFILDCWTKSVCPERNFDHLWWMKGATFTFFINRGDNWLWDRIEAGCREALWQHPASGARAVCGSWQWLLMLLVVCLSSPQLASCLGVFGYRICGCHAVSVRIAQHCAHFCAWVRVLMSTQVLN